MRKLAFTVLAVGAIAFSVLPQATPVTRLPQARAASQTRPIRLAPEPAPAPTFKIKKAKLKVDPRPYFQLKKVPPKPKAPQRQAFVGGGSGGCTSGYVHDLIVSYSWIDSQALWIASRESGCDPNAKNPYSSASGIFQLVSGWWAGKFNPFDPVANIAAAYSIWVNEGNDFCPAWNPNPFC